jgi:L-fuculose-phosphate aldolase
MNHREYCGDEEAKSLICDIGKRMYDKGFVAANDGNITIRVADDALWVTPAGVSKSLLRPEMLIKTDLGGEVLEGDMRPSSELLMHLRVYEENDAIVSTCHSHSPYALAYACAGIEPDWAIAPEPMVLVGPVRVAPFAYPGTSELADSIAPYCKDNKVVLMANHGSLTWGASPIEAWYRMEALEAYCKVTAILEFFPREPRFLGEDQIEHIMSHPEYGVSALGRHKGVALSTNTLPGLPLSAVSTGARARAFGAATEDSLEELANRIADKLAFRIGQRGNAMTGFSKSAD